ncbi:MAG: diguanylate cyclase [Proteobacteria bacterium]|nr:diguanylate cyclase [Pseudomonadota bacterium]NIS69314.1 diguanylate cyclase [Pseudomonadota bacterium]
MVSWEKRISSFLHTFRLDRIKSKILAFALFATLIPCLTMGWLSYAYNKRFLQEKITQEMRNATSHTAQELQLWFKERFYDVRVFSSSYEVSENMEKIPPAPRASMEETPTLSRLRDYLKSVQKRFTDYEEFMVVDPDGEVVATSADQVGAVNLPPDWLERAINDKAIVSDAYWDKALKKPVVMIAETIKTADGHFLGVFAAKANFRRIDEILRRFSFGETGRLYLVDRDGLLIIAPEPLPLPFMTTALAPEKTQALFAKQASSLEYTDYLGRAVVGNLERLPPLDWGVVAAMERDEAYAQIVRLQGLTVVIVSVLLLGVGLIAYVLGVSIVSPLDRLTNGAAKVAEGDLEVDLPIFSRGEVGYMTRVFNNMVARLRQGRDELATINRTLQEKNKELETISVTDSLTGLYNRKHLMETLAHEVTRGQRYDHSLSVLMIDIDHFKKYNDTFGHLAGDRLLAKMARIFKESIRSIDYVARYGGEEFVVMLPETGSREAISAAERIRTRVVGETMIDSDETHSTTISIGVAGFPENGDTLESVVASADEALYQAKRGGRNRVVSARHQEKLDGGMLAMSRGLAEK